MPDAMRCETCKHFRQAGEYSNWMRFGLGECGRMPLFWNATEWDEESDNRVLLPEFVGQLAFLQDGSDYKAYLIVSPEFGCVMHEASKDV